MQGILDAFIQAFRITNELDDDDTVNTVDLINALNHIDDIYIDTVEIYEDGFEMIEQSIPLGDASKCVSNLLQIVQYNDAFDLAANNLALEIKNSVRFHWRQLNPGSSTPFPPCRYRAGSFRQARGRSAPVLCRYRCTAKRFLSKSSVSWSVPFLSCKDGSPAPTGHGHPCRLPIVAVEHPGRHIVPHVIEGIVPYAQVEQVQLPAESRKFVVQRP